jgi:large subunit ribosomal protein L3
VRAYEHKVLDASVKQILDTALRYDAKVAGPIPLPTEIKKYTVNRSTFIYKDAREQFEMRIHKRVIDILDPTPKVIEALTNLSLPSGVTIDVKMDSSWPNRGTYGNIMKFILGTKGKMLTVYTEDGRAFAATVINASPAVVTQIKTPEKEGYSAVQIGSHEGKEKHVSKAQIGHAKGKVLKHFRELRLENDAKAEVEVGATIDLSAFAVGEKVEVSAISKGKGFAGVVKRHGFHGGPRSHGQKHSERAPGSLGGSGGRAGGRVAKGYRMAGRLGSDRVTVRNLPILQIIPETNELVIAGAIPGRKGTLVEIRG